MFLGLILTATVWLSERTVIQNNLEPVREVQVYLNHPFETSLTIPCSNVYAIFIRMINPNLENRGLMAFEIYRQNGELVRQIPFSGSNIGVNDWVRFQFEPLTKAVDEPINIKLTSDSSSLLGAIEVSLDNQDQILFRSYSKKPWLEVVRASWVSFADRFRNQGWFSQLYVGLVLLMVLLILMPDKILKLVSKKVIVG